jgi:hypothetical protein
MSWHQTKTIIKQIGKTISETYIEIYINNEIVLIRKNKSNDIPIDFDEFNLLILSRMKMLNIDIKLINKQKFEEVIQNNFVENNETFKLNTLTLEEHIDNICNPNDIKGWGKSITSYNDNMDKHNKEAVDIISTGDIKKTIEYMFKHEETGNQLTYSEMRERYG